MELLPACKTPGCELFVTNSTDHCSPCNLANNVHGDDHKWNTSEYRRRSISQTRCNCGAVSTITSAVGRTGNYGCANGGRWTAPF